MQKTPQYYAKDGSGQFLTPETNFWFGFTLDPSFLFKSCIFERGYSLPLKVWIKWLRSGKNCLWVLDELLWVGLGSWVFDRPISSNIMGKSILLGEKKKNNLQKLIVDQFSLHWCMTDPSDNKTVIGAGLWHGHWTAMLGTA